MALTVANVERIPITLPTRDRPWERGLQRQHGPWSYYDVFEVELSDGSVGFGDDGIGWPLEEHTPGVEGPVGENAVDLLWEDSLPDGIQHAVFDAVGRSLEVPVHELLGEKVNDETPLAWWCIDMPKEAWLAECEMAIDRGYRAVKLKGRPWRDIREQIRYLGEHLPEWFEISIDFNRMLLDGDRAASVLEDLDRYPQFTSVEGPIIYDDLEGNKKIQEAIDGDLLLHYGSVSTETAVCRDIPDGFVFYGAPASGSMRQAHLTAEADIPGFLQYPGTGLSAALLLQYGAVFETATLPGVSVYELYEHPLIAERFEVTAGHASIPDGPGLGVEVDPDAIEEFAVDLPEEEPNPPILTEVSLPDGRRVYMASNEQKSMGIGGEVPYFVEGSTTRLVPDDGSDTCRTATSKPWKTNSTPSRGARSTSHARDRNRRYGSVL